MWRLSVMHSVEDMPFKVQRSRKSDLELRIATGRRKLTEKYELDCFLSVQAVRVIQNCKGSQEAFSMLPNRVAEKCPELLHNGVFYLITI